MRQLVTALRAAARDIDIPAARQTARSDADAIPETWAERLPNTVTGKVARLARALLKNLSAIEDRGEAADTLRAFADTLDNKQQPGRVKAA